VLALLFAGAACSSDEKTGTEPPPECTGGGGPVLGAAPDTHCTEAQDVGMCVKDATGSPQLAADEAFEVRDGTEADDDDCKYHVTFTNSCVLVNEPVTFKVTLKLKSNGALATGANPNSPEVYLADDENHVSPSNDFTATESPQGTYEIGPIVFDRSGRWVVRFHFFEVCSDIPEDSPHGHIAFYVDVP
jgi:hypothetical protein